MADHIEWFVKKGDKTHGPFAPRQLRKLAETSQITAETRVRRSDSDQWVAARKVKGLFEPSAAAAKLAKEPEPVQPRVSTESASVPAVLPAASPQAPVRIPCPFCGDEIAETAIKCRHCNEFLDGRPSEQPQMPPQPQLVGVAPTAQQNVNVVVASDRKRWEPLVAVLLSFLIPGAGQMYKGQVINGLVWLVAVIVGYICLIVPGVILHLCCIAGAAMGDPYRR